MKQKLIGSVCLAFLLCCTACGSGMESSSVEKLTPAETLMQEIQETEPETVDETIPETQAEIPTETQTETETETETEMQSETEKIIIAQIYANPSEGEEYISLYTEPDAESTPLARLYLNDMLGVYSLENDWYYVQFDSLEGYVPANVISMTEIVPVTEAPTEAPTPEPVPVPVPEPIPEPEPVPEPEPIPEPEPVQTYTVVFYADELMSCAAVQMNGAHVAIAQIDDIQQSIESPASSSGGHYQTSVGAERIGISH